MVSSSTDTIAAIATASGRGGVGIVRVSGPKTQDIAQAILGYTPSPRYAHYGPFLDPDRCALDEGVSLYFPGPNSFTGEDVLELQAHGGPVILDMLLRRCTQLGARLAHPGEFSERAFLNDKLDLAQAEAIADLIDASSEVAARNALNSLQGVFSQRINTLLESLIQLRIYVEAAIDFPEEEIDFLADGHIANQLQAIIEQIEAILREAQQGIIIKEGMRVVIAGRPNAGKSSLLNALAGRETAIVTDIEGTTRDVLREHIHIDGMPLHIIDTAGLRTNPDEVERIGIARAKQEIEQADRILLVIDSTQLFDDPVKQIQQLLEESELSLAAVEERLSIIFNKVDLLGNPMPTAVNNLPYPNIKLSAKERSGLEQLTEHLKLCIGYQGAGESHFTARRRHIDALERTLQYLREGQQQLQSYAAGELLAEDLRQAQNSLGSITGAFTPDDLLGRIFSSFCIGK